MLQWASTNMLERNEKIERNREEIEAIKKGQMELSELKTNNWNFKIQWMDPTGRWKDRKESGNLKTEQ